MSKSLEDHKIVIDEIALEKFFNLYYEDVCRFLNYYTHDKQLVEDVIQDVFVRLWEDRFTVNVFYLKTYLYNAARNRMLNYFRDESNRALLLEEWAKQEVEKQKALDCVNVEEFSLVYQQAVCLLPDKCREIFILSRDHHKTYKEIASDKKLSIKTVEAQMSIATKRVREYITAYYASSSAGKLSLFISVILSHSSFLFGDFG